MDKKYDYRNCSSLFGYAAEVHLRSGGICQLCGCGKGDVIDFDLWRQLTVEHLIGESQGGYLRDIKQAIRKRFPDLKAEQQDCLAISIDAANTVTACSFCNSMTSRETHLKSMDELVATTTGSPEPFLGQVKVELRSILERKRNQVTWKLEEVRDAYRKSVEPQLVKAREFTQDD